MKYEKLEIEVVNIDAEDIIMTSLGPQSLNYGSATNEGVGVGYKDMSYIYK